MIGSLLFLSLSLLVGVSCAYPLMEESPRSGEINYALDSLDAYEVRTLMDGQSYFYFGGVGDYQFYYASNLGNTTYGFYATGVDGYSFEGTILNTQSQVVSFAYGTSNYLSQLNYQRMYFMVTNVSSGNQSYTLGRFIAGDDFNFDTLLIDGGSYSFRVGYGSFLDGNILTTSNKVLIHNSDYLFDNDYNNILPNGFHFQNYYFLFDNNESGSSTTGWALNFEYYSLAGGSFGEGYDKGYADGYDNGVFDGKGQGYTEGYNNGKTEGYASGYQDGLALAQQGNFNTLFGAIADTPIIFLRSLFNFDLFGMNVFIIIMSLITGIIIIYVIKKVWK